MMKNPSEMESQVYSKAKTKVSVLTSFIWGFISRAFHALHVLCADKARLTKKMFSTWEQIRVKLKFVM